MVYEFSFDTLFYSFFHTLIKQLKTKAINLEFNVINAVFHDQYFNHITQLNELTL